VGDSWLCELEEWGTKLLGDKGGNGGIGDKGINEWDPWLCELEEVELDADSLEFMGFVST
jgi:hypothetical protein